MSDTHKHQLEPEGSDAHLNKFELSVQMLLEGGCSVYEFRDMDTPATVLRRIGLSAKELHDAGYSPGELRMAGYTEVDLAKC